jgi:PEP-CTERM motif
VKNLILLSLVSIGLAASAAATQVQCSVLLTPNESGASTDPCTVVAPVGFYISSLTLTGSDDYTGYQSNNPVVSFGGTLSPSAALTTPLVAPTFCNVVTSGTNSVPCSILPNPDLGSNTNPAITSFSLQLTNISNTVTSGTITGASIVLDLDYGVTQIPEVVPTGVVPEPSTLGLLGGALVGVGFFARKKSNLSDS